MKKNNKEPITFSEILAKDWKRYIIFLALIIVVAVGANIIFFTIQSYQYTNKLLFSDWISVASVFSQILLVIIGCFVFMQFKIAKDDLKIRCKRDALGKSVELANIFANETIPKISAFEQGVRRKEHNFAKCELKDYCMDEINSMEKGKKEICKKDLAFLRENQDLRAKCIDILNNFEALALNFTKGVADEQALFTALSQSYCYFIKRNYAVICLIRETKNDLYYVNMLELYKIWLDRIEFEGLKLQKKGVSDKLADATKKCYNKTIIPEGA